MFSKRDSLGKNTEKHKKAKHHNFHGNNKLMKPIKQRTGLTLVFPDLWLTSEDYICHVLISIFSFQAKITLSECHLENF